MQSRVKIAPLHPISIRISFPGGSAFKSLRDMVWEDIPPFAVLTGVNGSGKSQLLELLSYRLTGAEHPALGNLRNVEIEISGDNFDPSDIAFLPITGRFSNVHLSVGSMQGAKSGFFSQYQDGQIRHDPKKRSIRNRLAMKYGISNFNTLSNETLENQIPDDFLFMLEEEDVTIGLAHVFMSYRMKLADFLVGHGEWGAAERTLGKAPWDTLNDILKAADFPYESVPPTGGSLFDVFKLRFRDRNTGVEIEPSDLSSGEKAILQMVLWLFNTNKTNQFPRLFLLDEPDAHLHPSMMPQLLKVLKGSLVDRYGVRVILATHSPSTVALAPEGSVFEMFREDPRIRKSPSKSHSIGLLTSGLVVVSQNTRYVLVEDRSDVDFYEMLRDILSDFGPSQDAKALESTPSLVFLPASSGEGSEKIGGGRGAVINWVNKFDNEPLNQFFRGATDLDDGNVETDLVKVLGRYSIENYLLDPIVVFGLLSEDGRSPIVLTEPISQGDEHLIRDKSESILQEIVDKITKIVEAQYSEMIEEGKETVEVIFTNGKKIIYPCWMLYHRGHDLLQIFQKAFGGAALINPPRLRRSFRGIRLIPNDLADLMHALQG